MDPKKNDQRYYDRQDEFNSINMIKYGMALIKLANSGPRERRFYIHENSNSILQWISPKKQVQESRIDITQINKIEIGCSSQRWQKQQNKFDSDVCLSIFYTNEKKQNTLDLVFNNSCQRRVWLQGLALLIQKAYEMSKQQLFKEVFLLQRQWVLSDKDGNGALDFDEVKSLMIRFNIYIKDTQLRTLFQQLDNNQSNTIEFCEFVQLMRVLQKKNEISQLFDQYSTKQQVQNNEDIIQSEKLLSFLHDTQKQTEIKLEEVQKIINGYSQSLKFIEKQSKVSLDGLKLDGFRQCLFSP